MYIYVYVRIRIGICIHKYVYKYVYTNNWRLYILQNYWCFLTCMELVMLDVCVCVTLVHVVLYWLGHFYTTCHFNPITIHQQQEYSFVCCCYFYPTTWADQSAALCMWYILDMLRDNRHSNHWDMTIIVMVTRCKMILACL